MKTSYKVIIKKSCYEILKISGLSHDFPVHVHNRACVGKIDSGEKFLAMEGTGRVLKKNDLFYIPPYAPHSCHVVEGKTVSYTVICADDIGKITEKMILKDGAPLLAGIGDIGSLLRYGASKQGSCHDSCGIIEALLEYIEENYREQLSVKTLANRIDVNPYYLVHLFKEKMGISPRQYIIQTRIKKTKERFLSGKSILDTALHCGFYDQSHYIRNFKRYVGTTPQKYYDAITVL